MTDKQLAKRTGDNLKAIRELRKRTKRMCEGIREKEETGQHVTLFTKAPKIDVQV